MSKQTLFWILVSAVLWRGVPCPANEDLADEGGAGVGLLDALYDVLDVRGVTYDRSASDLAAVEAALKAVDPRASIVAAGAFDTPPTNVPPLKVEQWDQKIGYLGAPEISLPIASNIAQQVATWEADEGHGIILDLRGAGGQSLAAVDTIAGLVVEDEQHLYHIKDLQGDVVERHRSRGSAFCKIPLIVLTDCETRDAAEILAAALKKQGRVMLVGSRTLGDATIRRPVPISDQWSAVVAFCEVCLGEACVYDGDGVLPDVPVEVGGTTPPIDMSVKLGPNGRPLTEKALQDRALMQRIGTDLVLRRAADILLGLKALGEFDVAPAVVDEGVRPEDK
ncbi:MAG: hypothetical protein HN341_13460 [Verrucomicrobia bacterium]|jgi:hypothetical protein|nr:hypothetical protein [Verrucomicrobiota bacterium]